jgi:phosphatidylserine decarboxylase
MWLLYLVPKNWLSVVFGRLMHVPLPKPLAALSIKIFGSIFKIDFNEAERPYDTYASIGDFFVRHLKSGSRPLADSPLLHPADSHISQIGPIVDGKCIQAKGRTYTLTALCGSQTLAKEFEDGMYVTYYLCPTDYHRVHSPIDGEVLKSVHIPGDLWPVNSWSTANIDNLFGINERVVLKIESRLGPALLVFVGATNVGKISLSFDSNVNTNVPGTPMAKKEKVYDPAIPIRQGQELGVFHMGSTVVMIYPKTIRTQRDDWNMFLNLKVRMGETFL